MEHNLFKPKTFEEGQHGVVGDCNGISMKERWEKETPDFAKAILKHAPQNAKILDYGCGVGRLAKEVVSQRNDITLVGVDASKDMMTHASNYVNDARFSTIEPEKLKDKFDVIYCVYVLQHVPSIELREVIARIHSHLKPNGTFVYCSSDYRMAIRFDNGGFFDDRFLGISIQEEIARIFSYREDLFDRATLEANPVLKTMVEGGLPHPAKVFSPKPITDYLHMEKVEEKPRPVTEATKLILVNRLAPGDILVMTNAVRDLHKAFPGKYQTEVRTPCNEIFANNPYITKLSYDEVVFNNANNKFSALPVGDMSVKNRTAWVGDCLAIDMQYPLIHRSGMVGAHFSEGHREWLEEVLQVKIPQTELTPELYLNQTESSWISPVNVKTGYTGKYWALNAGSKGDYTLKQYPFYQEVVDILKDQVQFVQIGDKSHNHVPLKGTVDMVGKTNFRELFRTIFFAEGVLSCVSLPMHVAAAFKKPCVVVAGAREGTRWELYPNHQFIYVNGCLPCATYDGCWRSKQDDCDNKVDGVAKCMTLITPERVVESILMYYRGGILSA